MAKNNALAHIKDIHALNGMVDPMFIYERPKIRYLSLFSGIEAFSCAVADMPEYEPVAFAEIDPFPCAVLSHHYPDVENLGDVTKIDGRKYRGLVDLIVGGSPCQGFSVAGLRKGLDDERSCLALTYVRLVEEVRAEWILWENVPGCVSTNAGKDLRSFLAALDDIGYSLSWTVLDSQYSGVAQRRRRVFALGHLGTDWERPAKVLLEPKSLCGDPPSRKKAREGDPSIAEGGAGGRGEPVAQNATFATLCASGAGCDRPSAQGSQLDYLVQDVPAYAIRTAQTGANGIGIDTETAHTMDASAPEAVAQRMTFQISKMGGRQVDTAPCIDCRCRNGAMQGQDTLAIMERDAAFSPQYVVRRITPVEAERLQGFPDGWTDVEFRGKPAPDTARYKALGNSMTVNVMAWIAKRILMVENGEL